MAKISQYTAITTLANGDLFDISQYAGGGLYDTRSIRYQDLLAQLQSDIVFPPSLTYFKTELIINSIPSSLPSSVFDQAVTGLSYTIPASGDYVFYASCNIEISNSDIKPMSIVLWNEPISTGINAVEGNSRSQEYSKKNEFQTCQTTFAIDHLHTGDIISVYLNNNNEADIDAVSVGRLMIQSWG